MFSLGTYVGPAIAEQYDYLSTELTPSESEPCHCCSCFVRKKKERKKFTVRRMPGKIAHLVPMQRFDSVMIKRNLLMAKPSNTDYHPQSSPNPRKTSALGAKTSLDDPLMTDASLPLPFPPSHLSTSVQSLKPSYNPTANVNNPDNVISPTKLQTVLSRFRQDTELIPIRFDVSLKRSSV